jgi:hypothetical protein
MEDAVAHGTCVWRRCGGNCHRMALHSNAPKICFVAGAAAAESDGTQQQDGITQFVSRSRLRTDISELTCG